MATPAALSAVERVIVKVEGTFDAQSALALRRSLEALPACEVELDFTRVRDFQDRAVGVPAGKDPNTGIINDVMTIKTGTGVFANATGFMVNHALLDLANLTLSTSVHGRICADGLE